MLLSAGTAVAMSSSAWAGEEVGKIDGNTAVALAKFGVSFLDVGINSVKAAAQKEPTFTSIRADEVNDAVASIAQSYRNRVAQATSAADLTHSIGDVVIKSSSAAASATGVGAIPTILVASAATWANDRFAATIRNNGENAAREYLAAGLKQWNNASGVKYDDVVAMLKNNKGEEAAAAFDKATGFLTKLRGELADDPKAADIAQGFLMNTFASTQRATLEQISLHGKAIDTLSVSLAENVKFTHELAVDVGSQLDGYGKELQDLRGDLSAATDSIRALEEAQDTTNAQLETIKSVLFDSQPASGKLALLKAGAVDSITEDQREKLIGYYSAEVRSEQLAATATNVADTIGAAHQILQNLGIHDKGLDDAVRYGTTALNAFASVASGNYVGAALQVSGLFGGGGPSAEDEHFQAIMGVLDEIQKKLGVVIELQQKTLAAVQQLSIQVAAFSKHMDERLDHIDFELKSISDGIRSVMWSQVSVCNTAFQDRKVAGAASFDDANLRFLTVGDLYTFMNKNSLPAIKCGQELSNLFLSVKKQHTFGRALSLRAAAETADPAPNGGSKDLSSDELAAYIKGVYNPAVRIAIGGWPKRWGNVANLLASVGSPTVDVAGLKMRVEALDELSSKSGAIPACSSPTPLSHRLRSFLCSDDDLFAPVEVPAQKDGPAEDRASKNASAALGDPIVRDQLEDLTKWTALAARALDISKGDSNGGYFTLDEIASGRGIARGKDLIWEALSILDLSIAQQAMTEGDVTAWFLYNDIWDTKAGMPRADISDEQIALLQSEFDPWLGRNVLMIALRQAAADRASGDVSIPYQSAYRLLTSNLVAQTAARRREGAENIRSLFGFPNTVEFVSPSSNDRNGDSGKLFAIIPITKAKFVRIEMPAPSELRRGDLLYSPNLMQTERLRALLAERFVDYELMDDVATAPSLQTVAKVILSTM